VPENPARIREAGYAATLPRRMREVASDLTAMLPDWAQDAGMRFEWASLSDVPSEYARVQSMISRGLFTLPSGRLDHEAILRTLPGGDSQ
jgi:hypothetical protein